MWLPEAPSAYPGPEFCVFTCVVTIYPQGKHGFAMSYLPHQHILVLSLGLLLWQHPLHIHTNTHSILSPSATPEALTLSQ